MIDRLRAYNSVVLVHKAPEASGQRAARHAVSALLEDGRVPLLVFFHGQAAALNYAAELAAWVQLGKAEQVDFKVCQAARARRVSAPLPPAFEPSTLVQFWDAAARAEQLLAPVACPVRPSGFLVSVRRSLDPVESREWLELVLAGASLDLDIVVSFEAEGLSFVSGDDARGWVQLSDHGLARLVGPVSDSLPDWVEGVDHSVLSRWRQERTVIDS